MVPFGVSRYQWYCFEPLPEVRSKDRLRSIESGLRRRGAQRGARSLWIPAPDTRHVRRGALLIPTPAGTAAK